jgi:hypothetical protein
MLGWVFLVVLAGCAIAWAVWPLSAAMNQGARCHARQGRVSDYLRGRGINEVSRERIWRAWLSR